MVRDLAFDICEVNVATYMIARDQGEPITAIPVFLFRKIPPRQCVHQPAAGIPEPQDLIGKRVGGTTLQPATNIWIRGILEEQYGVPHREQTWMVDRSEDAAFAPPPDLRIERGPVGKYARTDAAEGDLPAMMTPHHRSHSWTATSGSRGRLPTTWPANAHISTRPESFRSCRHDDQAGDRRPIPVGAVDAVPRVRSREAIGLSADGEPADGPAAWFGRTGEEERGCSAPIRGPMGSAMPTARPSPRRSATPTSRG